jgi:putative addiction module component (TIGR02574 family)
MSPETKAIFDAALALPETERALLAELLEESLPPPPEFEEVTEEEFLAELERRRAEYERDPSIGIPLSELRLDE